MKRLAIILLLVLAAIPMTAGKRLTWGLEWGYVGTFFSGMHLNYFSPDGWRADETLNEACFLSNGEVYAHIGWDLDRKWNLSIYAGYCGIQKLHHSIPVSLRATRYFQEDEKGDRWLIFMDAGSGISIKSHPQEIFTGKIGGGYSLRLSSGTYLNFIAALRGTYTHADIEYTGEMIPYDRINRNNAYGCSISLGISLSF